MRLSVPFTPDFIREVAERIAAVREAHCDAVFTVNVCRPDDGPGALACSIVYDASRDACELRL